MQSKLAEAELIRRDAVEKCKAADQIAIENERSNTMKLQAERAFTAAKLLTANRRHNTSLARERRDIDAIVKAKDLQVENLNNDLSKSHDASVAASIEIKSLSIASHCDKETACINV